MLRSVRPAAVLALAVVGSIFCQPSPTRAASLYPLTVNLEALSPAGSGTISTRDGGLHCVVNQGTKSGTCSADYAAGTAVTVDISASYDSLACYVVTPTCQSAFTIDLTIFGATSINNYGFKKVLGLVSVRMLGAGSGSVSGTGGVSCPEGCDVYRPLGSGESLTAAPDAGSAFSSWDNDGPCSGSGVSCTFTVVEDITIYAIFTQVQATPTPAPTPTHTPKPTPAGTPGSNPTATPGHTPSSTPSGSSAPPIRTMPSTIPPPATQPPGTLPPPSGAPATAAPSSAPSDAPADPSAAPLQTPAGSLPPAVVAGPGGAITPLAAGLIILLVILVGGLLITIAMGRTRRSDRVAPQA